LEGHEGQGRFPLWRRKDGVGARDNKDEGEVVEGENGKTFLGRGIPL